MLYLKRFAFVIFTLMLVLSFMVTYYTAYSTDDYACYTNVVDSYINITNNKGMLYGVIELTASPGTHYEGGVLQLKRVTDSITVFDENLRIASVSSNEYGFYNSYTADSGIYTFRFAIYAVKNGVRERINLEKTIVI